MFPSPTSLTDAPLSHPPFSMLPRGTWAPPVLSGSFPHWRGGGGPARNARGWEGHGARSVFFPGGLPGKHCRESQGSSVLTLSLTPRPPVPPPHQVDLTPPPQPPVAPVLLGDGARWGSGRNARDLLLRAGTGLSFPGVAGRVLAMSRRPPPRAPPGEDGVPGLLWWARDELRRRRTDSQHSPWAGRGRGQGPAGAALAPYRDAWTATASCRRRRRLSAAGPPGRRRREGAGRGRGLACSPRPTPTTPRAPRPACWAG